MQMKGKQKEWVMDDKKRGVGMVHKGRLAPQH